MDGSCHCGAVRWRFEGAPTSATACNCSICRRYGALWAYGFEGEAFTVSGETATYVWNREWLAFHFCARCACVVAWLATNRGPDGRLRGAVTLRLAVLAEHAIDAGRVRQAAHLVLDQRGAGQARGGNIVRHERQYRLVHRDAHARSP